MDLDALRLAAALVSPFPTWEVEAEDEHGLLEALGTVGSVPQADLFEPWETAERWRARVLFPDLEKATTLLANGVLVPGESPGLSEWLDRGRVGLDRLQAGPLEAICYSDLELGGLLVPELAPADGAWVEAHAETIRRGLGGQEHTLSGVRHPPTGRLGLLTEVRVPDLDPIAERRAVMDAVAAAVGGDSEPRLAPDLRWWFDMHRVFVLAWTVSAPGPAWIHDVFDASIHNELPNEWGRIEVHALLPEQGHDEAATSLGETLGAFGFVGTRPRWSRQGSKRVFLACWEGESAEDLEAVLAQTSVPTRVVPGCPPGLEADWLGMDPVWIGAGHRWFVRWRCALRDRDLLPECMPREPDAIDAALIEQLAPLGSMKAVWAGGAALELSTAALQESALRTVLQALGALPLPALGNTVDLRTAGKTTMILRRVDLPAREVPTWRA